MKEKYLTIAFLILSMTMLSGQLIEAEGDIKLDNTLQLFDNSSGTSQKVGSLFATFPLGANANNSPTLTLKTETSPIPSNGFADIILESSDGIFLNTNTSTRLYVGPSGRVGIGTTSPSSTFHVIDDVVIGGGSDDYGANAEYIRIDGRNDNWYMGVQNETTSGSTDFFIGKSSLEDGIFHIENNGNVGIGTTNPTRLLDVNGLSWMRDDLTIDDADLVLRSSNNHTYRLRTGTDGDLSFVGDGGVEKMKITDGLGRVGIGTTNPAAKLHLSGGNQSVELLIEADENNIGEDDQPKITLSQDGGQVTGEMGYYNSTNDLRIKNNSGGAAIIFKANGDIIIGNN